MYIKVSKNWQFVLDVAMIILGCFIMGFAFSFFLEPNNISTGGFSGLSMIINTLLKNVGITFLDTSIIFLILNIGLFAYSYKALGKKFAVKALVGILSFTVAMKIFELIPQIYSFETIISAVYGGAIMGVGIGMVVRFGGSTGGSDMIACVLRKKSTRFSIGKLVVSVDLAVIFLSIFAFTDGFVLLPYTILALLLSSFTTDFMNEGYRQVRAYYIITDKPDEIAEKIMGHLRRGCSLSKVKGMYTHQERDMLFCLISKYQINELKQTVKLYDSNAFIFATSVSEVDGNWTKNTEIVEQFTIEKKEEIKIKNLKKKELIQTKEQQKKQRKTKTQTNSQTKNQANKQTKNQANSQANNQTNNQVNNQTNN